MCAEEDSDSDSDSDGDNCVTDVSSLFPLDHFTGTLFIWLSFVDDSYNLS